jgi:hypothetical protein
MDQVMAGILQATRNARLLSLMKEIHTGRFAIYSIPPRNDLLSSFAV